MDQTLIAIADLVIGFIAGLAGAFIFVGQYKNKVDNLESTVGKDEHNGLRKTVADVRDKVISCETSLRERGPLLQTQSPVSLTDRGLNFLKDSGSERVIDDNFEELLKQVEALNPKTPYDVQEDARKVIEKLRDDDRLNPIKNYLFKEGATMEDAIAVMGVYLRDKVLEHKKWNVQDVDKH